VRLKSAAGALVAIIDDYEGFTLSKFVNSAGGWALRMNGNDAKAALFELDGQIEFWRRDQEHSVVWTLEYEGLVRWAHWYTANGALMYEAGGRGYIDLLNRRIINAASGAAGAAKTGVAETVIKAFVDEQCGPTAGARAQTGLTIQADAAGGSSVTLGRAYRNVLEVCQEIARIGGGDFDVVGTGAATYQFRWYTGQRGTDRSATVFFSLDWGNMAEPHLRYAYQDEITAVLVGGQGEGAARTTAWRTDATRIAASTWNRIEAFTDARQETATAGLNAKGDQVLDENAFKRTLDFKVLQIPGCAYRAHYVLGDLVTARFLTYSGTQKIKSLLFDVNRDDEQIDVGLEDV